MNLPISLNLALVCVCRMELQRLNAKWSDKEGNCLVYIKGCISENLPNEEHKTVGRVKEK